MPNNHLNKTIPRYLVILIFGIVFVILVLMIVFIIYKQNEIIDLLTNKNEQLLQNNEPNTRDMGNLEENTDLTQNETQNEQNYKEIMSELIKGDDDWTVEDKKTANDMTTMTEVLNLVLDKDQDTNYSIYSNAIKRIENSLLEKGWVKVYTQQLGSNALFATTYSNVTYPGRNVTVTQYASAGSPMLTLSFNYIYSDKI